MNNGKNSLSITTIKIGDDNNLFRKNAIQSSNHAARHYNQTQILQDTHHTHTSLAWDQTRAEQRKIKNQKDGDNNEDNDYNEIRDAERMTKSTETDAGLFFLFFILFFSSSS